MTGLIGVVVAVVVLAAVLYVALRREQRQLPDVRFTITADMDRFAKGVRALGALGVSFEQMARATRRATLAINIAGYEWARQLHAPLEMEAGVFMCRVCRSSTPSSEYCSEYIRLSDAIASAREQSAELMTA